MSKTIAAVAVLAAASLAWGLINPGFTPKHLVEQSDNIIAGAVSGQGDTWKIKASQQVKGKAGDEQILDLSKCKKDHQEDIRTALAKAGNDPIILFAGTMDEQKKGYVHLSGNWLSLKPAGDNKWEIQEYAANMSSTYAGGTDMLIRMSAHLTKDPNAEVPVSSGIRWIDHAKLGQIEGEIFGLAPVELPGAAAPFLFVACEKGDRLFEPKKNEPSMADVTQKMKLTTKSRKFAVLDVNADGAADLVSYDGKQLVVLTGSKDGFAPAEGWTFKLEGECLGLTPCSVDRKCGLLVSTQDMPILLSAADGKAWKKVELPGGGAAGDSSGAVSACIVADLNNDGFVDVLRPAEQSGVLWKGKAGGFETPIKSDACTRGGMGISTVADFNEDGFLDIFISGEQANALWENDAKAGFKNVFTYGGSISYKCPPRANDVQAVDLNHDGRSDLCLIYAEADLLYHWNRGYRSFGEEGDVRLPGTQAQPGQARIGQKAFTVADFNSDGSLDLVVAMTDGTIFSYSNDMIGRPGVMLRLPKGVAGPMTVSVWGGDEAPSCMGTLPVYGQYPGAYVSTRFSGKCQLRYWLDGKEQKQDVTVEDSAKNVIVGEKK